MHPIRLRPLTCLHVDDERNGFRYLIAECDEPGPVNESNQPDAETWAWSAPRRRSADKDPIVSVRWSHVTVVLQQKTKLSRGRVMMLERALHLRKKA